MSAPRPARLRQTAQQPARVRALHRDQRGAVGLVVDGDAGGRAVGLEPGGDLVVVGGVADHQPVGVAQAVDQHVVQHAAVGAAHGGVDDLAQGDAADAVGDQPVEPGLGAGAADLDLAHVGDVEEADPLAAGGVLGQGAFVLDGHAEAGVLDHAGPVGQVPGGQRSGLQGGSVAHGRSPIEVQGLARGRPAAGPANLMRARVRNKGIAEGAGTQAKSSRSMAPV